MTNKSHPDQISIDEAINHNRKYWSDPLTFSFEAEILEIEKIDDYPWIRLSKNYFYPEGGGQPADHGLLSIDTQTVKVIDVQERDDQIWLKCPKLSFDIGSQIHAEIDEQRRLDHSTNHSGQHLLSAIFWEELEFETTRVAIDRKETELELDKKPSFDDIGKVLTKSIELINQDLEVNSIFYKPTFKFDLNLRGGVNKSVNVLRVVEIGKYDKNACGGTHVLSTKEIGDLAITKLDGKRIKFTSSRYANQFNSNINLQVHRLSKLYGIPVENIYEKSEKVFELNNLLTKEVNKLNSRLIELQINSAKWKTLGNYKLKKANIVKIDQGSIMSQISDLKNNQVALMIANIDNMNQFLLVSGNSELSQNIMKYLRKQGVKGGGKGIMVMGKSSIDIHSLVKQYLADLKD